MKLDFKKGGAEFIALIICVVLIGLVAIIVMSNQKKSANVLLERASNESFLLK